MGDTRTPTVKGACVNCNEPATLVLGEKLDSMRYLLKHEVWCAHCSWWMKAAIKDQAGRWWGRREAFHE